MIPVQAQRLLYKLTGRQRVAESRTTRGSRICHFERSGISEAHRQRTRSEPNCQRRDWLQQRRPAVSASPQG